MNKEKVKGFILDALMFIGGLFLAFGVGTFMRDQADTVMFFSGTIIKVIGFGVVLYSVYRAVRRLK